MSKECTFPYKDDAKDCVETGGDCPHCPWYIAEVPEPW